MPSTAGYFWADVCKDSRNRVMKNTCVMQGKDTILVSDLEPFCSESDLTCTLRVGEVVNADFSTPEPHNSFDSFDITMFYEYETTGGLKEKALVHESRYGIFAEPPLRPWAPTITQVSL